MIKEAIKLMWFHFVYIRLIILQFKKMRLSMSLKKLANDTVAALNGVLPNHDLSDGQIHNMKLIIEDALIKSVEHAAKAHNEATARCCNKEQDMAHNIRREVTKEYELLTVNLSALR